MKSDERRLKILEHIVDLYIETGEPVGSVAVCSKLNKTVSPATIRNDMVKLENLGLLEQPHTSAGRVPTYLGFRAYINHIITPKSLSCEEKAEIDKLLQADTSSISAVIDNAVSALSEITGLAAVSTNCLPKFSVISKVEVIPTGKRIYAVLLITSSGEIKNKICRMQFNITNEQLEFFERIINKNLKGVSLDSFDENIFDNLSTAMGNYILSLSPLLNTLHELYDEISQTQVDMKGENNLLKYDGLKANELMEFMSAKNQIEDILSSAFSGINIVFGKEDDTFAVGNSSLILSKYGTNSQFGSFGVIGPIRLDYQKIIPYVSYFSKSVTSIIDNMLNEFESETEEGE